MLNDAILFPPPLASSSYLLLARLLSSAFQYEFAISTESSRQRESMGDRESFSKHTCCRNMRKYVEPFCNGCDSLSGQLGDA